MWQPWLVILLFGGACVLVLLAGAYGMWWVVQDRTGGAWRHRRPRHPAPWHRAPSGEYLVVRRRHRAEDLESKTVRMVFRAQDRIRF